MIIVVDTNVIKTATDINNPNWETLQIMSNIRFNKKIKIGIDLERKILKEYEANCKNEFYRKWISEMYSRMEWQSGRIDIKISKKLSELGFHEENDKVFVAVTLKTDKNIITEDSDYGKGKEDKAKTEEKQKVLSYMTDELEMNVMDYAEGLKYIQEQ